MWPKGVVSSMPHGRHAEVLRRKDAILEGVGLAEGQHGVGDFVMCSCSADVGRELEIVKV